MSTARRHPNVVNQDEIEPMDMRQGKFHVRGRRFGPHAGNQQLGGQLLELAPGERSFPFHYHCANEEAIFVVSGKRFASATRRPEVRVSRAAGGLPGPLK